MPFMQSLMLETPNASIVSTFLGKPSAELAVRIDGTPARHSTASSVMWQKYGAKRY